MFLVIILCLFAISSATSPPAKFDSQVPQSAWVNPGRGWIQLECVPPRHDCGFDCCNPDELCSKDGRCLTGPPLPPVPLPPPPPPPPPSPPPVRPLVLHPRRIRLRERCEAPTRRCLGLCCKGAANCRVGRYHACYQCCIPGRTCGRNGRCLMRLHLLPVLPLPPPLPPPVVPVPTLQKIRDPQRAFCPMETTPCGDVCCRGREECIGGQYCVPPRSCPPPGVRCGSACCAPWETCVAGVCGRLNSYCQYPRLVCGTECCEPWEECDYVNKRCFDNRKPRIH